MHLSIDFGASTIDVVSWNNNNYRVLKTIEYSGVGNLENLRDFLIEHELELEIARAEKIFVTGGKSHLYQNQGVTCIDEIEAIGKGGAFLLGKMLKNIAPVEDVLVVSMGTGTCLVHVENETCKHLGGTGVGGGTFLALSKQLLGVNDVEDVKALYMDGDRKNVDLSVEEIVGAGIGVVSGNVTASNLGKIARDVDFNKGDLAAGIVNLVGQTIATAACFAAKSVNSNTIVLVGKLTRIDAIVDVVYRTADVYGLQVVLPPDADYASAIGAGLV